MKKYIFVFYILFFSLFQSINAQVGIGTTSPDASAQLEVVATDKGVLLPRMTMAERNLIASPATSLLIFQTDNTPGYYYYNGSSWEKLTIDSNLTDDADWFEESTTTAPNTITDDIFTRGNVAIGKNTADYPLDILSTSTHTLNLTNQNSNNNDVYGIYNDLNNITGTGHKYGLYNMLAGNSNGSKTGSYTYIIGTGTGVKKGHRVDISCNNSTIQEGFTTVLGGTSDGGNNGFSALLTNTGTGLKKGMYLRLSGDNGGNIGVSTEITGDGATNKYGMKNTLSGTSDGAEYGIHNTLSTLGAGTHYGTYNSLGGAGTGIQVGTDNTISNSGDNIHYGTRNNLNGNGTGTKYGTHNTINSNAGGTHYGVYSEVLKTGSYSGYFLGNVAIGTTDANKYVLPSSDGTAGQMIQTDGSGTASWADSPTNFSMLSVHLNSVDFTTAGTNSWQTIPFNIEEFDTNNEFDTTSNKFTCISDGYYQIEAQFTTLGVNRIEEIGIGIYVESVLIAEQSYDHIGALTDESLDSNIANRQISKLVHLNAGDEVAIQIKDKNTAITVDGWSGKTFLTIHRVR